MEDSSLPLSSVLSFLLQQRDGNKSICSVLAGGSDGWGGAGVAEGVHWKSEDHEQKVENEKRRLVVRREIACLFDVSPG